MLLSVICFELQAMRLAQSMILYGYYPLQAFGCRRPCRVNGVLRCACHGASANCVAKAILICGP